MEKEELGDQEVLEKQKVEDLNETYQEKCLLLNEENKRKEDLGKILQKKKNSIFNQKEVIMNLERNIKK